MGHEEARTRALCSLDGLSLGDAFGFKLLIRPQMRRERELPDAPWRWSDDTHMALSVVEELLWGRGELDLDYLSERFLRRYQEPENRGYGSGMRRWMRAMEKGASWKEASGSLFGGQGSMGNGGAMRAAPIGAYHCHDLEQTVAVAPMAILPPRWLQARESLPLHGHVAHSMPEAPG